MQESSLHYDLKLLYCEPGGLLEHSLDGYIIDIINENKCIEIQTGNFQALKPKLAVLLPNHLVKIVYPINKEKWIEKRYPDQPPHIDATRRRSPKKGTIYEISKELIFITPFLVHPNFSIECVFISQLEVQYANGLGSWRRNGVSILDHKLEKVFETVDLNKIEDYKILLPPDLPQHFTSKDFSMTANISLSLARKTCYLLRKLGLVEPIGKINQSLLYQMPK